MTGEREALLTRRAVQRCPACHDAGADQPLERVRRVDLPPLAAECPLGHRYRLRSWSAMSEGPGTAPSTYFELAERLP